MHAVHAQRERRTQLSPLNASYFKEFESLKDEQKLYQGLQWVGYGLGAALVATGLIIHFLAEDEASVADALPGAVQVPRISLSPLPGGSYGALAWDF